MSSSQEIKRPVLFPDDRLPRLPRLPVPWLLLALALIQAGATLWYANRRWWDGWEAGYRRDHCDYEQTHSGVSSPYCDDIDEWGRKN